jgi:large subunit ribosomal protein L46
LPFTRYFYFKKKTPADLEWKRKIKERLTPARDIGRYKGYGEEAWNDELLVGAEESNMQWQVDRLIEDAEKPAAKGEGESIVSAAEGAEGKVDLEAIEKPMSRVTEADLKGDVKSLNRLLQRTLYLLVKNKEGNWAFPADRLQGKEALHSVSDV